MAAILPRRRAEVKTYATKAEQKPFATHIDTDQFWNLRPASAIVAHSNRS
jgi:hypothetical protein